MSPASETFRILVADDEPGILRAYNSVLTSAGGIGEDAVFADLESELFGDHDVQAGQRYELVLCQQGEQAIAAVRNAASESRPFSVAFLDVRMPPGINGVEAARAIRAIDPDLHIVFVTAYSDTDPRNISRLVPPVERLFYVAKPFQPQELQQFASALTHKWRAEQDLLMAHELLKRQFADLEIANRKATAANRAKTEFLANISHEVRTPLNAIIGFSELMLAERFGSVGNEKYREYLSDINASGSHLLGIMNDIIDFSRLEIGDLKLEREEFDVAENVQAVVSIVHERALRSGIAVDARIPTLLPTMKGDARRVRQILLNLISNSIKFTHGGGKITVSIEHTPEGEIALSVADTGIGIAPDDIDRALAPFEQVDGKLSRRREGAGLGLPLAKSLTELHGGRLHLESKVGEGTVVTVKLPLVA
jgi:signal transduction histidine kinase